MSSEGNPVVKLMRFFHSKKARPARKFLSLVTRPAFGLIPLLTYYTLGLWLGGGHHPAWMNSIAYAVTIAVMFASDAIYEHLVPGWSKLLRRLESLETDDGISGMARALASTIPGFQRQVMEARANAERRKRDGL